MNIVVCIRTFVLFSAMAWPLAAHSPSHAADKPAEGNEAALFDAAARGQLAMRFVPASEKKGTLTLVNRTRTPLSIRMPDTMGGVPVLTQFLQQQQPQALGLTQRVPARDGRALLPVAWKKEPVGRVVHLAAGDKVDIPLQGVCLQFGNPTPNSRMRYELVPVERVTNDSRVAAALLAMADGSSEQPAVQAVAWHLANGKSWKRLSGKFSKKELKAAQLLLE